MTLSRWTMSSFETIDTIIASGCLEDGTLIDPETLLKLWRISGKYGGECSIP